MRSVGISLLGFGNVGQAFAQLLLDKQRSIQAQFALDFKVVAIRTGRHGAAIDLNGISLPRALDIIQAGGPLSPLSQITVPTDVDAFLEVSTSSVMAENTPVSYNDGQPALDHIRAALTRGIHVITANKGPVVHAHQELTQLAAACDCRFLFESTVMDGAPIFSLWRASLPVAKMVSFRGILNSTTNLILSRMESGETFESAVKYAQSIGIAETDPSGDLDGWDAAIKVAALVTVLMGHNLLPLRVEREGIGAIGRDQVQTAIENGQRWKLVCEAHRQGNEVLARVQPQLVDHTDPLYSVMGTSSAVTFHSDVLGALTITEADPGPHTTAYGLLADLLNIFRTAE